MKTLHSFVLKPGLFSSGIIALIIMCCVCGQAFAARLAGTDENVSTTTTTADTATKIIKASPAETTQRSEEADKLFGENLAQLSQRTAQVTSGLLNIGLEATVLNDEQLIELFYNFYNPQTVEHEKVPVARE